MDDRPFLVYVREAMRKAKRLPVPLRDYHEGLVAMREEIDEEIQRVEEELRAAGEGDA